MNLKKIYYTLTDSKLFVDLLVLLYNIFGKKPWSIGYWEARNKEIAKLINDKEILSDYSKNTKLPKDYGKYFDERVVEYPWLISKIQDKDKRILDAGSILNFPFVVKNKKLLNKKIIIANLNPERYCFYKTGISYVYSDYADIRRTCFKDSAFDLIICGSVLEHIGMDNTYIYSSEDKYNEQKTNDYLLVIDEFRRLLKRGGRLLLTFPFGKYENLGWLQQFDKNHVNIIFKRFGGKASVSYFKYTINGWIKSNETDCNQCQYFDIHKTKVIDNMKTAAARSVACIEIQK